MQLEGTGIEPACQPTYQDTVKQLTSALEALGGYREDDEFTDCQHVAGIHGLWNIIKVWHTLTDTVRKEMEALCLQPPSLRQMTQLSTVLLLRIEC